MKEKELDFIVSAHKKMKMLNWWEGEDPFQIIVETIGTQQCKLIQSSTWGYELKLQADEFIGGNMLSTVEDELEDWVIKEKSTWSKEAGKANKTQDWDQRRVEFIKNNNNRIASAATRSLWAWYGRNFPKRVNPKFITTKDWTIDHKMWLVDTNNEDIIEKMNFNIINSNEKLSGIKGFIVKELDGFFNDINMDNAEAKLRTLDSVGEQTARKIALFYYDFPYVIFDTYFLRIGQRHGWVPKRDKNWKVKNKKGIENDVNKWLEKVDEHQRLKNLKAIYAMFNDCGNLYCKKDEEDCRNCPLFKI